MPEARTESTRTEPLRLARTESMLEARPKPEVPNAEEMFLSPRVLDAGAFARYADMLKSMIADARQGARDLQDFSADADQMKATCEKTGEQLRTRIEAGARVVKLIDERSDRAEKLIDTVRRELPDADRVRAMIEPAVKAALDSAQQRAAEITLDAERRARATATEIEQKINAMGARAAEQAARLERVGEAIEQRLAGLENRLAVLAEQAGQSAASFEQRTHAAAAHAQEQLTPALDRARDAAGTLEDAVARAAGHADEHAARIAERLAPLRDACETVLDRLGLDRNDPDPAGSVLGKLENLVRRSEATLADTDAVLGRVEHLRGQAESIQSNFGQWLLDAADQVDRLEARRERLAGPLAEAAEKVARVAPALLDDIEHAATHLDQLQTEQAILREAVQASAMLARKSSGDLNNQSAQLKALIDGSVHTLTRRVEEAGMWLGQLIIRAEHAANTIAHNAPTPAPPQPASRHTAQPANPPANPPASQAQNRTPPPPATQPREPARDPARDPVPTPRPTSTAQATPPARTPDPVIEPISRDWNNLPTDAATRAEHATARARPAEPAAPPTPPAQRSTPRPPTNTYGLPLPPSLPIDAISFDGADMVFGRDEDQD